MDKHIVNYLESLLEIDLHLETAMIKSTLICLNKKILYSTIIFYHWWRSDKPLIKEEYDKDTENLIQYLTCRYILSG